MVCKGCQEIFSTHIFYRHVSHSTCCKESYGEEWEKMRAAKRKIVKGADYGAHQNERLKASKEYYEKNKKSISDRMKQYYLNEKQ